MGVSRKTGSAGCFAKTGLSRPRPRPSQEGVLKEPERSLVKEGAVCQLLFPCKERRGIIFPSGQHKSISHSVIFVYQGPAQPSVEIW